MNLPSFSSLWKNSVGSDLIIRFDDGDIPGHKAVFASTCKALKTRWFEEGKEQDVIIMTPGYSKTFVRLFVYGHVIEEDEKKCLSLTADQILDLMELGKDYDHETATKTAMEKILNGRRPMNELERILKGWPLNTQNIHTYGPCINKLFSDLMYEKKSYNFNESSKHHFEYLEKLNIPLHVLKMWTKINSDLVGQAKTYPPEQALAFVVHLGTGGSVLVACELLKEGNWTRESFKNLFRIDFSPEKCRDTDTPFCQELWEIAINVEIDQEEYENEWQEAIMKQLAKDRKKRKIYEE